jgi:succinyl-diaminopimelate desuccinylase
MIDVNELKRITKKLISFKTVRPDGITSANKAENDFIREITKTINFITKEISSHVIIDIGEEYIKDITSPVLIVKFYETREPALMIIGHIDVVDGEESQFQPFEKDGKIYGRGAKDMKSGVAAMIAIMNHYASHKIKPNIALAFVSDEETGGYNGANMIVNEMNYRPRSVISPDPGERHCIINREKGFVWFSYLVYGKNGHPSRPWLGDNAVEKALKVWEKISKKYNLAQSEDDWKPSASITDIKKVTVNEKGTLSADNSIAIPAAAYCRGDIRFTEKENPVNITNDIMSIVSEYGENNLMELHSIGPVCYTPSDSVFVQSFKKSADAVEEYPLNIYSSAGASDLRFFSAKGIPCLNYAPHGANHHAANEYVDVKSIEVFCKAVINYIDNNL